MVEKDRSLKSLMMAEIYYDAFLEGGQEGNGS